MTREQLIQQIFQKKTFLCVGLDPDIDKLPGMLRTESDAIFRFNRAIIDATAPYCVAYKPNLAFYEAYGTAGIEAFAQTCAYIRRHCPDHFIIADAKRGDIGNTAARYAQSFFGHYDADAVTVAPYMGSDSIRPFLGFPGKWTVILALTSNPSATDYQLVADASSETLYQRVLRTTSQYATADNAMYVVGATQASMLADVRRLVPRHFLLVPGVGAQGGSLSEVCRYGMNADCGLLVNSSRGIIYAAADEHFAEAAAEKAKELQQQMEDELRKIC